MNKLIIIPTYNERQNIRQLVEEILALSVQAAILIVDDNSPDGTAQAVQALAQENPRVCLLSRPQKLGLGGALKAGYEFALKKNFEYILQLDADFSHDPRQITRLFQAVEAGAGLAIGSRYIRGAGAKQWSFFRLGLSFLGNLYARLLLGFNISDSTSGFRCFNAAVLKQIDLSKLISRGYGFQVEMTYLCHRNRCLIKEVPIVFSARRAGHSKLNFKIIMEAFITIFKLKFLNTKKNPQRIS